MKFIDLFAGIGGFRTGMEMNGHECVAFCEIDKYARQSYKAIYDTEGEEEIHDITQWTDEHIRQFSRDRGHIDVITGGFPCQSFSIAGKRGGFNDTRGTLFFEIMRVANIIRPQYLFLENVKGLLNHDKGATFEVILNTLDEFGYNAEWQVLNSKNFGVPQNRERVFIIGHLRGSSGRTVFPIGGTHQSTNIERIGNTNPGGKGMSGEVYGINGVAPTLSASDYKEPKKFVQPIKKCNFYAKDNMVVSEEVYHEDPFEYDYEYIEPELRQIGKYYLLVNQDSTQAEVLIKLKDGVYETVRVISDSDEIVRLELITPKDEMGRMGEQAIETFITNSCEPGDTINAYNRTVDKSGLSPTLTTRPEGFKTAILPITGDFRIRKLTPLECWRLQGFTDEQFYKAKNAGVSNSQLYKQAGNSVTVNVINAIARKLI